MAKAESASFAEKRCGKSTLLIMLEILKQFAPFEYGAVMHCYSGSYEMAIEFMKLGLYISLGGPVTFKNARVPKEIAEKIDINKLLIETDCPYLAPTPFRGKRNESSYVKYVCEEVAKIRGLDVEEVEKITTENSKKLFKF